MAIWWCGSRHRQRFRLIVLATLIKAACSLSALPLKVAINFNKPDQKWLTIDRGGSQYIEGHFAKDRCCRIRRFALPDLAARLQSSCLELSRALRSETGTHRSVTLNIPVGRNMLISPTRRL
jgi:hypothetical protein